MPEFIIQENITIFELAALKIHGPVVTFV